MISSTRNERVLAAIRLHRRRHRRALDQTIIEGPAVVEEALRAGVNVVDAFYREDDDLASAQFGDVGTPVTSQVLARVADTEHPRGPVAIVEIPRSPLSQGDTMVLVGIADPGNAGTMIRSAAAFGFSVAATPGTVDLWSPKTVRAGAGAHFHTGVTELADGWMADLTAHGLTTVALVVAGGEVSDLGADEPVALLVGEEAAGLPGEVVESADRRLTLTMAGGIESLNAAIAASIAMYERSRSRT